MESKKVVVVGGVAGGMSFATRYRRLNQNDQIIVLDKGPYVSFANCGLPFHISGEIESRDDLLVAKREMLESRFQIDVRVNHEVLAVDSISKTLKVKNNEGFTEISYDTLILSVGAQAIRLNIDGMSSNPNIFSLRNIPDMDQVIQSLDTNHHKSAVVIGAGFIGLEMAEALKHRGLEVSVVEKGEHVLAPFDKEMAQAVADTLHINGIKSYSNTSIVRIDGNKAYLEDGSQISADIIIMAVGVRPASDFLATSDIQLSAKGGIIVNTKYETSVKDIYAVGDAIVTYNAINKEAAMIALASPANRQGRHLADILSGIKHENKGSLGSAIVRLFDMTFAATGLKEVMLNKDDIYIMHLKANDHASYFPNATPIHMKVIFDKKSHLILGAQAFGKNGVDKRIDVIATAIRSGLKINDLQELELTYAPPYGSAKDIINMAGYVGENLILGLSQTKQWYEVSEYQNSDDKCILDVRNHDEYREGHIQGAIHMPLDQLRCLMNDLPLDKEILVYCASGIRSYNAEMILRSAGYNVKNLDGAYGLYELATKGEHHD